MCMSGAGRQVSLCSIVCISSGKEKTEESSPHRTKGSVMALIGKLIKLTLSSSETQSSRAVSVE